MTDLPPYLSEGTGQRHVLAGQSVSIGRAAENGIVITGQRVSREHARVRRDGRHVWLEDLGSTNGTFLNGERVLAPAELRDGDQVAIGASVLTFHDPNTTFQDGGVPDIEIDRGAGVVRVNRRVAALSPKEFALLAYLYEHRNQVCSKDQIGQAVWPEAKGSIFDYQIENLMRRLRARVEPDPARAQLLLTVRGLGYKLVAPE